MAKSQGDGREELSNRDEQSDSPASSPRRTKGGNNPANNLSHQDRVRGGEASAQSQDRDEFGHFAGNRGRKSESPGGTSGGSNRGNTGSQGGGDSER